MSPASQETVLWTISAKFLCVSLIPKWCVPPRTGQVLRVSTSCYLHFYPFNGTGQHHVTGDPTSTLSLSPMFWNINLASPLNGSRIPHINLDSFFSLVPYTQLILNSASNSSSHTFLTFHFCGLSFHSLAFCSFSLDSIFSGIHLKNIITLIVFLKHTIQAISHFCSKSFKVQRMQNPSYSIKHNFYLTNIQSWLQTTTLT